MNTEDLVVTHMSAEQQIQHQQQQENQIEEVPEIATLPNYLKEWLILEDELTVLANAVKEKKKRMGILQGIITKTMKGHKLARVNIKSGAILYQNKVTKESMGKRFIVSRLTEYFKGDIIKATEVYNFLEENRGKKIKDNIKLERN